MNIIFLTVSNIETLDKGGIYSDLMRKFRDEGHHVYIVSPAERRFGRSTYVINEMNTTILKVWTLNIQKTNVIEKGIGSMLLNGQYVRAIRNHLSNIRFDLIIYSTPPITLTSTIISIKKTYNAKTYLLLKDIFPQNAVDIGMIKKNSILYKYFRSKERKLYLISDHIGCMSPANVKYLIKHNPQVNKIKIEVNPNSIEPKNELLSSNDKVLIRKKMSIPQDCVVFIYGGNLGKPQGLDFLIKILESNKESLNKYFLIVGSGTEYNRLKKWFDNINPPNARLIKELPKEKYEYILKSADVGLIFLDRRFTVPNYPSRLLSYLEFKLPIIAATDVNTDIGDIAEKENYGFSLLNGDIDKMNNYINLLCNNRGMITRMGENGRKYLEDHYTSLHSYTIIEKHLKN